MKLAALFSVIINIESQLYYIMIIVRYFLQFIVSKWLAISMHPGTI